MFSQDSRGSSPMKSFALMDQFQRDVIRLVATLFGPILIGALIVAALLLVFRLMGIQA
jgi:hypothetical protein